MGVRQLTAQGFLIKPQKDETKSLKIDKITHIKYIRLFENKVDI